MMVAMLATLAFASCKSDNPVPEANEPTVSIEVSDVGVDSAKIKIAATDAEELYLYCTAEGAQVTAESVKANGRRVDAGVQSVDGLEADTEYVAYAAAFNGAKSALASKSFKTSAEPEEPFEGHELTKLIDAVYRNDNEALAGNYEVRFGNTTSLGWEGDIQVFLDLYNEADADPLNAVLPRGEYVAETNLAPFTYKPSASYVDIVVEGGEVVTSPIFGTVTVEREGATYTITVEGTLMLLDDLEFSARYVGPVQFVQGGTSSYEYFEEDLELELTEAQMRYWGGWFYPFCDDVGVEMFSGEFNENGTLTAGYYLHMSRVFMPKYADYNAESVPLAAGTYAVRNTIPPASYCLPYYFEGGKISDLYGERYFTGTYLQYVENGLVKRAGIVTDGEFTVEFDGAKHTMQMNFITDNGTKLTLSFSGRINSVNYNDNDETMPERPWSTLTDDHVYSFPAEAQCFAYCYGDTLMPGYDMWFVLLYGYNSTYPDGYGDMFTTEFLVEKGARDVMPTGRFTITDEIGSMVMLPGIVDFAGNILFTNYGDLTPDVDGYSTDVAPISSGEVVIEDLGDGTYGFTFDMTDDAGNKITGQWSGAVEAEDISSSVSSAEPKMLLRSR